MSGGLIFRWAEREGSLVFKMLIYGFVGLLFVFVFGVVKVGLEVGEVSLGRTGSVFFLEGSEGGMEWAVYAEEEGPFPLGMDLVGIGEEGVSLEGATGVFFAARDRDLGLRGIELEDGERALVMIRKGERFFPERVEAEVRGEGGEEGLRDLDLVPILYPLSADAEGLIPEDLPDFDDAGLGGGVMAVGWRFLLRLRADGSVEQCVSLTGAEEMDAGLLEEWLMGVRFGAGDGDRWISVGMGFRNEAIDD